ncbi:MAG: aminotransferase class V-fold PLP-dependent enzyme [Lachnospiraceae bacterium]|nr:aminotransferase class V-fold PLP-dependent enzyme [Lachnospiraceae bacterium]
MGKLSEKLAEYGESGRLAFHMPGHKRRYRGDDPFFTGFYKRDITEIEDFDDLHDPEGILAELQQKAADYLGAEKAFYLVNGSTAGVLASVCSSVKRGGRLIMQRESHMSAYHAVMLQDITPLYLYGEHDSCGILSGISIDEIKSCGPADAIFITSPTYEGVVLDVKVIAEYAHSAGMKLIVDAAHGAHFGMGGIFPQNALRLGADYETVSVHKTMYAPTQTALLGLREAADADTVSAYLDIFQSSSPSYPLMAGIEESIELAEKTGTEEMLDWQKLRRGIEEACRDLEHFVIKSMEGADPYKLTILMKGHAGGCLAADILRERYDIETEMALPSYMLLILSMADEKEDYERLVRALHEMDKEAGFEADTYDGAPPHPLIDRKPSEAFGRGFRRLLPGEAVGGISAGMVVAYPPGRPVTVPGEVITDEVRACVESLAAHGVKLRGIDKDMRIRVL